MTTSNDIPDQVVNSHADKLCKVCVLVLLGLELNGSVVPLL